MLRRFFMLMEENDGGEGDKGGGGGQGPDIASLMAKIEALEAKLNPKEEPDLKEKLDAKRKEESKEVDLESALKFNITAETFLKENESLLPEDTKEMVKIAQAEKYDSQVERSNAVKVGIIQSFFAQQDNLDLLTEYQKNQVESFLKLTKNGKQDKARVLYDQIFEPALAMKKKILKAEELAKGPGRKGSAVEDKYKEMLIKHSRKNYLGEKA